jgi:hypothetical protein
MELLVTISPSRAKLGHPDPGEDLTGRQCGGQVVQEELARADRPLPALAAGDHRGVQCGRHRRKVPGRVGVGQGPADRAAVADGRVGDQGRRLGEQPTVLA